MSWSGWPDCLGLNRLRNGRPLGYGRGFIFSLLDCLEHVARLRYARPVDLLLGLAALCPDRPGAVLPATLKVLAHPLCFIFFKRAGVCLLFDHTDVRQGVKDRPALYFEFAC
jgi:hypothetical protein